MKTFTKFATLFALAAALCFGQTALSSTTLGAAVADTVTTSVTLTSTSTMQNAGPANRINTCLYIDKEVFGVVTVVDSTHAVVQGRGTGCGAVGASARPTTHGNGTKVYFANTTGSGNFVVPAATYIGRNSQQTAENWGSCTSTAELVLPRIYLFTGEIFDCRSSGQWIKIGEGTMGTAGTRISGFCTGTVGSAETEFLNGAACSGATTATARQVVTTPGVLANFRVFSSAASLGTGGTIAKVVLNGTATAIVCSMIATGTTCSDSTHSVAVVPGDVITFSYLTSTSDTAANISAAVGVY